MLTISISLLAVTTFETDSRLGDWEKPKRPIFSTVDQLHPTAQKLIDATLLMLETNSVEQIGIERVLDETKVARSSLYHHFENFPHLLECAVAHRFASETKQTIQKLRSGLDSAIDQETFKKFVLEMNESLQDASRSSLRMQRIVAFATTDKNTRFLEMLKSAQQHITDEYTKILLEAQKMSWIRSDIDPQAVAVFVQAMTIGRVVDDVAEKQLSSDSWVNITSRALTSLLW